MVKNLSVGCAFRFGAVTLKRVYLEKENKLHLKNGLHVLCVQNHADIEKAFKTTLRLG